MVNAADADDLSLTGALLKGIKKRFDEGKGVGTLIHTSGAAIFGEDSNGVFDPQAKFWTVGRKLCDSSIVTTTYWFF